MIRLSLSKGQFALIDAADAPLILKYKWFAVEAHRTYYAARSINKTLDGRRTTVKIRMHRVIIGAKKGEQVDHINCDGLDNRRANLRIVSGSVNQANGSAMKNNVSGLKGVTLDTFRENTYFAFITRHRVYQKSKGFQDPRHAGLLRDQLARLMYPEGVYLNFPDEVCPDDLAAYAQELFERWQVRVGKGG